MGMIIIKKPVFRRLLLAFALIPLGYFLTDIAAPALQELRKQAAGIAVGQGKTSNLHISYQRWLKSYNATPVSEIPIGMVWNKGLSSEYNDARGLARIDIQSGQVWVKVQGLTDVGISDVWLLDRSDSKNSAVKSIKVGQLTFTSEGAWLNTHVDTDSLKDFQINWVVLAHKDTDPMQQGILFGSTSLFQRVYHYPELTPPPWETRAASVEKQSGVAVADGILPAHYPNAEMINLGRSVFFNETFSGNGRTCGTCHPENNNHALDPTFIATLPDSDPLFLAERPAPNPLANNFEKPELMRKVGLILENSNGFSDLQNNFTMRSVSHLLGMRTSLSPPSDGANDGTSLPPNQRTGWSGDGSPTNIAVSPQTRGTLRDFAIGAVIQHFPITLNRSAGQDFRLPTETELDALEAYMLSLGRQQEFDDLTQISLTDVRADTGRRNYLGENLANGIPCNACHLNGGANTDPNFDFPSSVTPAAFEISNRSFAPRVEELIDQPGDVVFGGQLPFDDGFGSGTSLFNVPTVIEAADTGPFFHSNQIDTVEGLISFYTSQRHLRNGEVLGPIVGLNGSQVANVGAFMRVVNADENLRIAIELITKSKQLYRWRDRQTNIRLARAELKDAIEVLQGGHLHFDDAVPLIKRALKRTRYYRPGRAIRYLKLARTLMIIRTASNGS